MIRRADTMRGQVGDRRVAVVLAAVIALAGAAGAACAKPARVEASGPAASAPPPPTALPMKPERLSRRVNVAPPPAARTDPHTAPKPARVARDNPPATADAAPARANP
ncbi:MAG: hypothetical protein JNK30_01785 [Phenylobacterium sp.]|uniref:hypothetical protein n=1 Tax=Phenylobacterium sp. TaxID=1871053 RepID=UPI001A564E37|nr:hypothetical protein [Phenylobacterium sp.]MBL8770086.1 hypothetical protein [Phenylobacterium sp.]